MRTSSEPPRQSSVGVAVSNGVPPVNHQLLYLDDHRNDRVPERRPDERPTADPVVDNAVTVLVITVSGSADQQWIREIANRYAGQPAEHWVSFAATPDAAGRHRSGLLSAGGLHMDPDRVEVTVLGQAIELTHQEYLLLKAFMQNPGRVLSRTQLLEQAWECADWSVGRTVDVHVRRLRTKLGTERRRIVTVRGFGYRFEGGTEVSPVRAPSVRRTSAGAAGN
jgi:DNA-binding winged helix-turn-helix (wHTH) protein